MSNKKINLSEDFSTEELLEIFLEEEFSKGMRLEALFTIQENIGFSDDQILEFLDSIPGYETAKEKAKEYLVKPIQKAKEKAGSAWDSMDPKKKKLAVMAAGALMAPVLPLPSDKHKVMDLDDAGHRIKKLFTGVGDDEDKSKEKNSSFTKKPQSPTIWQKGYDFVKRKIFNTTKKESYNGEFQMKKSFSQFREELPSLEEQYFIEDLDNESLFYVLESDEYDEEDKENAYLELLYREVIEIDEDGPMTSSVKMLANQGAETKKSSAPQHPLEIGATRSAPKQKETSKAITPKKSQSEKPVLMGPSQLTRYKTKNADLPPAMYKAKTLGDVSSKPSQTAITPKKSEASQATKPTPSSTKTVTYQGGRGAQSKTVPVSGSSTSTVKNQATKPASVPASNANKTSSSSKSSSVLQQQRSLIAKGAKIKADGIMGPKTAAAQKQFGSKAAGASQPRKAIPSRKPVDVSDINKDYGASKARHSVERLRGDVRSMSKPKPKGFPGSAQASLARQAGSKLQKTASTARSATQHASDAASGLEAASRKLDRMNLSRQKPSKNISKSDLF